jgi:bla regulator protein BlaR1
MVELADELPDEGVSRVVVDKTGLAGRYDFSLRWTPDEIAASGQSTDASGQENQGSLFTALQEQAGLKLVPEKAPVKVMVIDGLDRPSEN